MSGPELVEDIGEDRGLPGMELVELGPPFVVDSVALERVGPQKVTLEQCGRGIARLCKISDGIRYWRGDLMNLTEGLFAEEAAQVIDHELLSEKEAKAEMFVASHVTPTMRSRSPSWEHSNVVARLPPGAQGEWLDRARAEDWSARKLATEIAVATGDGKTFMKWFLVVDTPTEAKRDKLADRLAGEGWTVSKKEAVKKAPKPKKAKKEVTAKRRGPAKMSSRKRVPK